MPHPRPDRPHGSLLIPSIIAGAGALMLAWQWRLGRMLWLDEEMIAINIRDRALPELAGRLSLGQAAPFGWLALERGMLLAFGPTERALRAVPVLFGIALLCVAVWVGRRWMSTAGAAALTFLCAAGQWVWFHALELKHYSADTCFGLFIPALAVWAIERDRALVWWVAAAAAQWFSNGALFVAPVCALVIVGCAYRRSGSRGAVRSAWPGLIWLASFALNDVVSLGPARTNEFLRHYWENAFPPAGSGVVATLQWLGAQFVPLALKPLGSGYGPLIWVAAAGGFVLARRYSSEFRLVFALVPLSAMLWSAVRLVPMFERLSLWMVPSVYVGVALSVEAVSASAVDASRGRQRVVAALAALASVVLFVMFLDIARRGATYVAFDHPIANHEVDDRAAVRWLARQRQPGDVWVTTRNALAAIWWYANDDAPVMEAVVDTDANACGSNELGEWLRRTGTPRVLVYLGFGHVASPALADTLVGRLGLIGRVVGYDASGEVGHALVVDLRQPPSGRLTLSSLGAKAESSPAASGGCIAVAPAVRW